jgi:hypothetical protein
MQLSMSSPLEFKPPPQSTPLTACNPTVHIEYLSAAQFTVISYCSHLDLGFNALTLQMLHSPLTALSSIQRQLSDLLAVLNL